MAKPKEWETTGITYGSSEEHQLLIREERQGFAYTIEKWDDRGWGHFPSREAAITAALKKMKSGGVTIAQTNLRHPTLKNWLQLWETL